MLALAILIATDLYRNNGAPGYEAGVGVGSPWSCPPKYFKKFGIIIYVLLFFCYSIFCKILCGHINLMRPC